jgi:fatty acid desaturase
LGAGAGWDSWWAIPAFLAYGIVYNSADSKWHDLSHGTPFKTVWINEALYILVSFMTLREPVRWRWSHARHHTHTIIVGLDPEIAAPRPPKLRKMLAGFWYLYGLSGEAKAIVMIAFGRVTRDAQLYVPQSEWPKMIRMSRWFLLYIGAIVGACVAAASILPAMFIGLPRLYGSMLHYAQAYTQHAGLAEDVPDFRLNARTVLMNPVFAFLYTNMNYHIEHHMFPMVPFYRLPDLHARLKSFMPPPYPSLWAAWREYPPSSARNPIRPILYADLYRSKCHDQMDRNRTR